MCTLVVLHRCIAGKPLVVAANRDEFFARPAEDLAIRASQTGPILSPLDLEAGGTWVGLSERGVFAGLTNLRPLSVRDTAAPEKKLNSRGDVVMAALEAESAAAAVQSLMKLEEAAYNPFQLVVADGKDAWLIVYRDRPRAIELEPGPHVVGNVEDDRIAAWLGTDKLLAEQELGSRVEGLETLPGFEGIEGLVNGSWNQANGSEKNAEPRAVKLTRIRERVEKLVMEPGQDLFEGLARICREHVNSHEDQHEIEKGGQSPFEATCVHVADRYGTRSSLILELSENHEANRLWATNGPPCEQPFDNRSSLLSELGVRLGS
jgi:uncharacterized protein with NRDE domain